MKQITSIQELDSIDDEFEVTTWAFEDEDLVQITFNNIMDPNDRYLLANYLHPKLQALTPHITACKIKLSIVHEHNCIQVSIDNHGDYENRLKFEQFLQWWIGEYIT